MPLYSCLLCQKCHIWGHTINSGDFFKRSLSFKIRDCEGFHFFKFWIYIVYFLFMFLFTVLHLPGKFLKCYVQITIPTWHTGSSLLNVVLLSVDLVFNLQIKNWKLMHLVESGADACIDGDQERISIYWISHWFLYLYNIPKVQLNDVNSSLCKSPSFCQGPSGFS